jgi:5'-phosphate synthase pdxT subunit
VLALQGDFEAHCRALTQADAQPFEVRTTADLERAEALVLPGGESTTMLNLLDEEHLFEPLRRFGAEKPMFGTCAGAILLAREVLNPRQRSLGLVDISVERNAYGRQIDSRIASISINGEPTEAVFIRAPVIRSVGSCVKVLGTYLDAPVLVEEGRHMVATFHPELATNGRLHRRFVEKLTNRGNTTLTREEKDPISLHR